MLIRSRGRNVPPTWIERARESRKRREAALAEAIKKRRLKGPRRNHPPIVQEWETAYQKECFYRGLRALLELERKGKTKV